MKRFIQTHILRYALAIILTSSLGIAAAQTNEALHITDIEILPESPRLSVSMTVNPVLYRQSRNSRLQVTPVVRSKTSADSITLPSFEVAGTNTWYRLMRSGDARQSVVMRSGHGDPYKYNVSVEMQPWMEQSRIDFICQELGCCDAKKGSAMERPVAEIDMRTPQFVPEFLFDTQVAAGPKTRSIEGKAFINFPVNKIEIYPDYMVNPVELHKITGTIDSVKNNSDITVKTIRLVGFASPEGPYKNNVRLASGRTQALREYVRKQYTFPASVFQTASVPEDWQGLREAIANGAGNLDQTDAMLAFIDNPQENIETKNDRFAKLFPTQYAWLLKNVYPTLRHTNYEIIYDVRLYTDVNEIREILKTRPQDLSLNEFYLAAASYPDGSNEQDNIYLLAAMLNPGNEQANLNAAFAAMREQNPDQAQYYIERAGNSAQALYAKAALAALRSDYTAAEQLFSLAAAQGEPRAAKALLSIKELQNAKPGVTFIADPNK